MPARSLFWLPDHCWPNPNVWRSLPGRMCDQRRRLHACRHSRFYGSFRERRLLWTASQIRIDDDLAVVAKVHRLKFLKLLPPFAQVGYVNFEAVEIIRRSQVDQYL